MVYKASLDTLAKKITIGVFILLIAIGLQSVSELLKAKGDITSILIESGILMFFVIILLGSWLYAPQSYSLNNNELTINRPIGNVKINKDEIKLVRILEVKETRGTIRTFGVGGLFGYFGKFHIPGIGNSTFYATQRKNQILIETKTGKKIIITPNDISLLAKFELS